MEVRRRTTLGSKEGSFTQGYLELIDDKTRRTVEALGFKHWFLVIIVISIIYGCVVYLHRSMPNVIGQIHLTEFSEERARNLLKELTALGPRPSGSIALEDKAFKIMQQHIYTIKQTTISKGVNRFEIDVQRPSGCFDLKFLSSFTLCYYKITNIVVRIGPISGSTNQSLLLNCHYDTMPDTPGATDDAVSCAIMMDVLDVLAHSDESLKNDVVFLFNGAEENFLQGAHGFIQNHPWRHTIHAFINLEGTGSGGREILFQAGPGNSWLLQTYLESAPHPFCSVFAQEIFQSGIIPSDTDFRIFRDYGRISGLDIAYTKNGWVYHTEFDEEWRIEAGAIQRAGENILAVVRAILSSPYLVQAASFDERNRWVFYDVVGLFTVFYTVSFGQILNYGACSFVAGLIGYRISRGAYSFGELGEAFWHHICAFVAMILTTLIIVNLVLKFDLLMCWYKLPEIVGPLYVLPVFIAGATIHTYFSGRNKVRNIEMVQYDSVLITYAAVLFVLTWCRVASAFFVLNCVAFPLLKDPIIFVMGTVGLINKVSPSVLLVVQLVCFTPVFTFALYAISQCVDFFVPVMGRLGNAMNPEFIMASIGFVIASSFLLFVNNLFYISRRMNYLIQCGCAIFVFFFVALVTTRLGVPYEYSVDNPRLRRIIALHTNRTIHDSDGNVLQRDNGLFVQSLDYRGAEDLPVHSFLQGSTAPNCTGIKDEYCRLPYYTAVHELFPPEHSLWVPVPSAAPVPYPIKLRMIDRVQVNGNRLNITFELRGGYDKMSLHITPLSGYELVQWSFTNIDIGEFGHRTTYFVFLTYGFEMPEYRTFWILLENSAMTPYFSGNADCIEIAVASHHAHGEHQNSETLRQLRHLIQNRRQNPEMAVGCWRWAMTMIGGIAEIVVHVF
ncbi:peptidase, M28 family [Dictyocaulus viviparus]|uniref:FXNA-like protease n=1 Tax=Dictyocaulus viviparus TaxID=29172 RepID=A0A0D8XUE7_DICVI|nr:peptidase, M28 family [Dictyocaulus viviparus]